MSEPAHPTPGAVSEELARILESRTFAPSARHRDLLKFIVESRLQDPAAELKESALAVDVLGRDPGTFDPRIDTIVRVEARRLRARLDEYYAGEGAASRVRISVPRGSYSPVFLSVGTEDDAPTDRIDSDGSSEPLAAPLAATIAIGPAQRASWRPGRLTALTLLVLAIGGGVAAWWRAQEPATAATPARSASLAVLPFANLSGDASLDPFIDGLVDEITGSLARVPGLRVIARTSAFAFKGQNRDIRGIGRSLGVTTVVEGSVQRSEGRLKIIVQLNRTDDGSHLWSDVFVTPVEEIFKLQTRITDSVTGTLEPAIRAQVMQRAGGTTNWPAWEAFSRAQFAMRGASRDGYVEALPLLDEAVRLDPEFARAYAARGVARMFTHAWAGSSDQAVLVEIRRDIEHAISLDPGLTSYLATLAAWSYLQDYDWPKAEVLYKRAMSGGPATPDVHAAYAGGLLLQGRAAEAEVEYERALALDPMNLLASMHRAALPFLGGRPADAIDRLTKLDAVSPGNSTVLGYLARARLVTGDLVGARREVGRLKAATTAADVFLFSCVDAMTTFSEGRRQDARAIVDRLAHEWGTRQPYLVAESFAWLGNAPDAVRWFLTAVRQHDGLVAYMPVDPMFDPIRPTPEFRIAWDAIPGLTKSIAR